MEINKMQYYKSDKCRYCSSENLDSILSLGEHPPSNSFIEPIDVDSEEKFPLELYLCRQCNLVQLRDVVSASNIFDDYHYTSSSSKALVKHFESFTNSITSLFNLKKDDLVVDIGCNDGITLDSYPDIGLERVGVEPSNVGKIAEEKNLNIVRDFFSVSVAEQIVKQYGRAKIITATNVFAHIDDMHAFVKGIPTLMHDEGVFIVEVSYLLDLIDDNLFDTIYHEHLCYLSLTPVINFLKDYNLVVFNVERHSVGASGPSITIYIKKKSSDRDVSTSVADIVSLEKKWGIASLQRYKDFAIRVASIKEDTLKVLKQLNDQGFHVGGFGAPAKGNTLLNYYGLDASDIEVIADNTQLKQGKLTPGTHIPIINDDEFLSLGFKYALLLSWNYKNYFLEHSDFIKKGGKFIVPLPFPHILP
jgi:hypothetical protein